MTRRHRLVHRLLWPALLLAVAVGLTLALVLRPPPPPPAGAPAAPTEPAAQAPQEGPR